MEKNPSKVGQTKLYEYVELLNFNFHPPLAILAIRLACVITITVFFYS